MFHRYLLATLLMVGALAAQTVNITNHSLAAFDGWKRTTIDTPAPFDSGVLPTGETYVVGKKTGLDVWVVDIKVSLPAGGSKFLDLSDGVKNVFESPPLPTNIVRWYGGPIAVNGVPMGLVDFGLDGAAVTIHMRSRQGRMFVTDVWLRHYMGQPYAEGEAMITCSNPGVIDLQEQSPEINFSFGDAIISVLGSVPGRPLIEKGVTFSDGQAMVLPFTAIWARNLRNASDWSTIGAVASHGVQAVGIDRLMPEGGPVYGQNMDALLWARNKIDRAIEGIDDFGPPSVGIAANSTQTGSQEDQIFVRGEAMISTAALLPTYLSALKFANRPCHHRELSGAPLTLDHENLVIWTSRPHHHPNIGSDKLGKLPGWEGSLASVNVTGGWNGPDREHWLLNTLTAGLRYTGSPALQYILRNQAVLFMYAETVDPSLSTSHTDAARSVGYAGMVAVHLWYNLQDRAAGILIRDRWRQRVTQIYIPEITSSPGNLWDPRADDRIIGDFDWVSKVDGIRREPRLYTSGTMMWQQSLGAYGLDYGCMHLGPAQGRVIALAAAQAVLDHAWRKKDGTWIFWDNVGYIGGAVLAESEYREGFGVHRTGWFDPTWAIPGIAVLLRHNPDNAKAQEIWDQLTYGGGSWVPPGIR
jgi:hypothetical protein